MLECDASDNGIGVALMQNGHPIAFESKKFKDNEKLYLTYDKEILAIIHPFTKFRQYLGGSKLTVRSDHNSPK